MHTYTRLCHFSRNYFLTTSRGRPPRSGFFPVGEFLNIINSIQFKNVKNRLRQYMNVDEINKICFTFDSYFCEWNGKDIRSLSGKTIFIEEVSMVPNKWMTKIYKALTMFDNTVYMFGDPNQCSPVEGGSQIHYNYLDSVTVHDMCPNSQTLQHIEKSCRYNSKTHYILSTFLNTGRISTYFEPTSKYYKNVCYLNSTRITVNTECCKRFIKENIKSM